MPIAKKRLALIRDLEAIIGNECYNANIQNWGPNGTFYGTGREFRYPITFTDRDNGGELKRRDRYDDLSAPEQMTGRYKFGSNELHINSALNKVLEHLQKQYGFKI